MLIFIKSLDSYYWSCNGDSDRRQQWWTLATVDTATLVPGASYLASCQSSIRSIASLLLSIWPLCSAVSELARPLWPLQWRCLSWKVAATQHSGLHQSRSCRKSDSVRAITVVTRQPPVSGSVRPGHDTTDTGAECLEY